MIFSVRRPQYCKTYARLTCMSYFECFSVTTPRMMKLLFSLRATRGTRNPNLQAVITHASHVCSQYSFGLLLRMNGMHKTQFDHAHFDLIPLIIWSRVFWQSVRWNLRKAQRWSKSVWTSDRCRPHSLTFGHTSPKNRPFCTKLGIAVHEWKHSTPSWIASHAICPLSSVFPWYIYCKLSKC